MSKRIVRCAAAGCPNVSIEGATWGAPLCDSCWALLPVEIKAEVRFAWRDRSAAHEAYDRAKRGQSALTVTRLEGEFASAREDHRKSYNAAIVWLNTREGG